MIAAYLRFWDLALNQANLRGLFPKYAPRLTWEIEREALKAPYFYVGIRNGSLDEWNAQSQIRQVRRDLQDNDKHTLIKTLWGGSQAKDSTGAMEISSSITICRTSIHRNSRKAIKSR